ncbi:MAG: hypothetical protein ACXWLR_04770 [Myxococcales bacterium]
MQPLATALVLGLALSAPIQSREAELAIVFENTTGLQPLPQGALVDFGVLSAKGARRTIWRSTVRIRLQGTTTARFARLSASLRDLDTRCRIRLDGTLLSALPQVVDAQVPVGRSITHSLEIEIPASEPPGPIASSIEWLAETL